MTSLGWGAFRSRKFLTSIGTHASGVLSSRLTRSSTAEVCVPTRKGEEYYGKENRAKEKQEAQPAT